MIIRFLKDESGVTAIEYSLIAAMVSVVALGAFKSFGEEMRDDVRPCRIGGFR